MMRSLFLLLLTTLISLLPVSAFAQKGQNPIERLNTKTEDMMKGLDKNQTLQFEKIRTAHGTIRAVNDVRVSLDRAAKNCVKNNPPLKEPMTARIQAWKNSVLPVMRRGENRLEKMILTQTFARPSAVRTYLKVFDDAVSYQDRQVTEIPVSSADDCKSLIENMEDSEKIMGQLITETLGLDQELKIADPSSRQK